MGRWNYSNRDVAEECRVVDISFLKKHGFLKNSRQGLLKWTNSSGKENSISVESLVDEEPISIIFSYKITKPSEEKENLNYKTELIRTPCNYGGFRYWFKCGGIVNGVHCGKRVSKLYKSPMGKYFLCRHCYNLTYDLRKKSRSWGYEIEKINKKIIKIDEKTKKKGIHTKTLLKLLKQKNYLSWDLHDARLSEMQSFLFKIERSTNKLLGKNNL